MIFICLRVWNKKVGPTIKLKSSSVFHRNLNSLQGLMLSFYICEFNNFSII